MRVWCLVVEGFKPLNKEEFVYMVLSEIFRFEKKEKVPH